MRIDTVAMARRIPDRIELLGLGGGSKLLLALYLIPQLTILKVQLEHVLARPHDVREGCLQEYLQDEHVDYVQHHVDLMIPSALEVLLVVPVKFIDIRADVLEGGALVCHQESREHVDEHGQDQDGVADERALQHAENVLDGLKTLSLADAEGLLGHAWIGGAKESVAIDFAGIQRHLG